MKTNSLVLAATVMMTATAAVAEPDWRILAQFDDTPEGLVADGEGGLFVSMFGSGQVLRISPDGTSNLIGDLRDVIGETTGTTLGIDWDGDDTIYVAFVGHSERYPWPADPAVAHLACADSTVVSSGLYAVTVSSGAVRPVATRESGYAFCYPDDPVVVPDGTVFVSDLSLPGIWRVNPATGDASLWSEDPLFDPGPSPMSGFPVGPNGIALAPDGSALFAVTGGNPMLLRIPITQDGTAGSAQMVSYGYDNMDGLEIGSDGNFYVTEALRHEVWQISPDATQRQQIGNPIDAPLGSPASIAFMGDEICVANLNFFGNLPPETAKTVVCASGVAAKW